MDSKDPPEKYILSEEPDFCEECGQWKPVIVRMKLRYMIAEWFYERSHLFKEVIEE